MTHFVTFYSWKGGVGRTMALANVAVQLARRGRKVLMVDFDLEAPGLNRYFVKVVKNGEDLIQVENAQNDTGLLGLLIDAQNGAVLEPDAWQSRLTKISVSALTKSYAYPNSTVPETLHLLPSGHGQLNYATLLSSFSWDAFYQNANGDEWLEQLREQWKIYDFVLIDSRTGLTDSGGICTVHFPDWLVLCFTANDQSLEGGLRLVDAIHESRRNYHRDRGVLLVVPLLSRWDGDNEVDLAEQWMERFDRDLRPLTNSWLPLDFSPRQFLERVRVPHVARFSFGEPLPVITHSLTDPALPGRYFDNLARVLDGEPVYDSRRAQINNMGPSVRLADEAASAFMNHDSNSNAQVSKLDTLSSLLLRTFSGSEDRVNGGLTSSFHTFLSAFEVELKTVEGSFKDRAKALASTAQAIVTVLELSYHLSPTKPGDDVLGFLDLFKDKVVRALKFAASQEREDVAEAVLFEACRAFDELLNQVSSAEEAATHATSEVKTV